MENKQSRQGNSEKDIHCIYPDIDQAILAQGAYACCAGYGKEEGKKSESVEKVKTNQLAGERSHDESFVTEKGMDFFRDDIMEGYGYEGDMAALV